MDIGSITRPRQYEHILNRNHGYLNIDEQHVVEQRMQCSDGYAVDDRMYTAVYRGQQLSYDTSMFLTEQPHS